MSPQSSLNILAGSLGSTIASDQAIYTGAFARLESVGVTCVISGVTTNHYSTRNATYLNGKTLTHPFSITVPLNTVQLWSGACNLVNGV